VEVGKKTLHHRKAVAGLNQQVHRPGVGRQHAAMQLGHRLKAAHAGGAHGDHPAAARPASLNGGHQLGGHLNPFAVQLQLAEVFGLDRTNGAQVWNHSFYWQCMKPGGGGQPTGALADKINADFGSYEAFVEQFRAAGATQFGSGWAWLVLDGGSLKVTKPATPICRWPTARRRC